MARSTIERRRTGAVRTVGGRAPDFAIEFDARTAWDFLVSLGLGDAPEHDLTTADRDWLSEARASLSTEQRERIDSLFTTRAESALDSLPLMANELPTCARVQTWSASSRRRRRPYWWRARSLVAHTGRAVGGGGRPATVTPARSASSTTLCSPPTAHRAEFPSHAYRDQRLASHRTRLAGRVAPFEARSVDPGRRRRPPPVRGGGPAAHRRIERSGRPALVPEPRIRRIKLAPCVFVRRSTSCISGVTGGFRYPVGTRCWRPMPRAISSMSAVRALATPPGPGVAPAHGARLVPDRARHQGRAVQAHHEAPPRPPPSSGPRDRDRGGVAHLLPAPAGAPHRRGLRAPTLSPSLTRARTHTGPGHRHGPEFDG